MRLPGFAGSPIQVQYLKAPRVLRRKLHSGPGPGVEVHAASFIRERRIVLDAELLKQPAEHGRILAHELFHFVWVRLGNAWRRSWAALLRAELRSRVRGELGWSAELAKSRLRPGDAETGHVRFRRYASESFCDTAAWVYGRAGRHPEHTLVAGWRAKRRAWFANLLKQAPELRV